MTVPDSPADLEKLRGSGMPERSARSRRGQPWDVQYVGGDAEHDPFAYTRGLWQAYRHPELYADTRPVAGAEDDPEWHLTMHDMGEVLNAFAERVRSGERFAAGDTHDQPVDEGRTTLRWAFDDAAADWPSAHQVHPQAPVLHLSYVLARQPVRDYSPPTADDVARLRPFAEAVLQQAHEEPRDLDVADGAATGPFADVVEALALLAERATEDDVLVLAGMATAAVSWQQGALGAIAEEARISGRQAYFAAAQERASRACDAALTGSSDPHERHVLKSGLMAAVGGAMGAWIVADLVDEKLFHMSAGLLTGFLVGGHLPDAEVQEQVAELHRRLRTSTPKERTRVLRSIDRDEPTRIRRVLILTQQALATGAAPLWRTLGSPVPAEVDERDRDLLTWAYDGAVAALILGSRAPEQDSNAALNPFRVAFKMRELGRPRREPEPPSDPTAGATTSAPN